MLLHIRGGGAARAVALALLIAPAVTRAELSGDVLRLDDVLALAHDENPDIRAARSRANAAATRPSQERAWDDPVLSWEAWNAPENMNVARAENNIFRLSQRIPFPGKRRLAAESAGEEARAVAHGVDAVILDVEVAVKRAYWDLWRAHQRALVYDRERVLAERVAKAAEQRYAASGVPQSDVLRAQIELTRVITEAKTAGLAIDSAKAGLNALLSRAPDDALGVPEQPSLTEPPVDHGTLMETALSHRPELAAQSATISGRQRAVALARKAYLPDFEVSVGRFVNAGSSDGFGTMASVTLPIANKARYDAGVSEASARLATTVADQRRLEDAVRRDVEQSWLRVRTAKLRHDLLVTTHLPQAEQAIHVTEGAYVAGRGDLLALLDMLRAVEMVHLEHVESAAELETAWADLERAVGVPLPNGPRSKERTDG